MGKVDAPKYHEDDLDVYAKNKKNHNSMASMYMEIPDEALETHQFGSIKHPLSGLPTINTILRHCHDRFFNKILIEKIDLLIPV